MGNVTRAALVIAMVPFMIVGTLAAIVWTGFSAGFYALRVLTRENQ
jgi:hypothetical protein